MILIRRLMALGASSVVSFTFAFTFAFAQNKVRRNVEVEFEKIEGASSYEVKLFRKGTRSDKPLLFKTKEPSWTANIKPGLYLMQIRSFDSRGVPGDWSPEAELLVKLSAIIIKSPAHNAVVDVEENDKANVTLQWEPIPGAKKYQVNLQSKTSAWKKEDSVSDPEIVVNLPVGENFVWNAVGVDEKGDSGEISGDPYVFTVRGPPLTSPSISTPLSEFLTELKWSRPDKATHYAYELKYFNSTKKSWELIDKSDEHYEAKVKLDISRPTGKYRLVVRALGSGHRPSPDAQLDFKMRGGFRNESELESAMLRESLLKPTRFYAVASYLITQIDYQFTNYDANSAPKFKALGGTGRLGLGYQGMKSKWGAFGLIDLSGFAINGANYRFAASEGHVTRRFELGPGGLLIVGGGLFYKQLPIMEGTPIEGFRRVGRVSNIGPHAGFTYWKPFTQRLGLQANARAYYTLMGSSDTGQSVESSLSYQYGLMGSYRLSRSWMGYAGYAFRHDETRFSASPGAQSFAKPGNVNEIAIEGHYLNLLLEFSF